MENQVKKERKTKSSILDPFKDEIKYLYDLGVSTASISRIINDKMPWDLSQPTYRNYIRDRIKTN